MNGQGIAPGIDPAGSREPEMPGQILRRAIEETGMSERSAASKLGLSLRTLSEVLRGKRRITRRTAQRLAMLFPVTEVAWLVAQAQWDAWLGQ